MDRHRRTRELPLARYPGNATYDNLSMDSQKWLPVMSEVDVEREDRRGVTRSGSLSSRQSVKIVR